MQYVCYNCFHYIQEEGKCPLCGYDPQSSAGKYRVALKPGTPLANRYLVGRVLGQGGFGVTYVALDSQTQSRVAIKEYLPMELAIRDPETSALYLNSEEQKEDFEFGKQQFLEEAKTLTEFVGNEHIVRIHNQFEENGTAYFSMEYVEGIDLKNFLLQRGTPLPVHEANRILLPIMEALQWVHSKGIVHRDISPDNIMITKGGSAKLIDFGAARYSTGEKSKSLDVVLKHGYAPVEQYSRRGRQGPFTDVYSMAATYYYAITGKVPQDAVDRMSEDELIPPSEHGARIRESTEQVLLKALALNAADRWQTMNAFYAALLETMPKPYEPEADEEKDGKAKKPAVQKEKKPEPKTAAQKPAAAESSKLAKKKPTAVIAAVLGLVVLLGVVFGTGILKKNPAVSKPEESVSQTGTEETTQGMQAPAETPVPAAEPETAQGETDSVKDFKNVGSIVTFGFYEQDNNTTNRKEPIEWIVLDVRDGKSLLISRYALDSVPFNTENTDGITWETSTLRKWLNEDFLNDAFIEDERECIPTVEINAGLNPDSTVDPGNNTKDKVFLLSILEAEEYFDNDISRQCKPTEYAKAQGCYVDAISGNCCWWLRSPGSYSDHATVVDSAGSARSFSEYVSKEDNTVRPVIWIDLNMLELKNGGGVVSFGTYEQDNDFENGKEPIEWIVLDVQEGKALLISRCALDCQPYNTEATEVTWETCSLRKWLNEAFLTEAFSEEELAHIPAVEVTADKNPRYSNDIGNSTEDKVFLLSIQEADRYFVGDEERQCPATLYAVEQGCSRYSSEYRYCWWWLRTPASPLIFASEVLDSGAVDNNGSPVNWKDIAVRPAIWVVWDN